MAPKRLKEDPPRATPSGEEEESENDAVSDEEEEEKEKSENEKVEEEDEDDDDDEEEEDEDEEKSPAANLTVTPSKTQHSSGSDTESGSGSDSESGSNAKSPPTPSASAFTIKPIASRPMAQVPIKPTNPSNNAPISSTKRAAESDAGNAKDSKKRKVTSSSTTTTTKGDDEDPKKASGPGSGANQRLWGEENELAVLKGMIEYRSKKGSDPNSEMGAFHEFIKNSLRGEVSKAQLMDKTRRMRKKYKTNFDKGGHNMVFTKPHEQKSFELSKKIWGTETTPKPKTNANSVTLAFPKQEVVENGGGVEGFWESYPCLRAALEAKAEMGFSGFSGSGSRFGTELMANVGSGKLRVMEDKCREIQMARMELYVRRTELDHELGVLLLGALKRRD